jgi:broad specificity phosphatase PhoE
MSFAYFIRHGQASAHAEDYDQLSPLGYDQSVLLSSLFQDNARAIDHVWVGPRKRHRQTYESSALQNWPEATPVAWLDEFPAHDIMTEGMKTLRDTKFQPLLTQIENQVGTGSPEFLQILQYLCDQWINHELILDGIETGKEYQHRIATGMSNLKEVLSKGESVVIFSSAGAISSSVGFARSADPMLSLRSAWALYNASISTLRCFQGDFMLVGFNWIDHVPDIQRTFV